jgi:glucose-6-phosphate 1-dehydrogenase
MKCVDMSHSDAIVFFGATGDLAYKQIFPALQALVKRHTLDIPIIGVAKAGWTLDQLRTRARESVAQHCGVDEVAFGKLSALLQYVDGDYREHGTYAQLRKHLGRALRPSHYLAIPLACSLLWRTGWRERAGRSGALRQFVFPNRSGTVLTSIP